MSTEELFIATIFQAVLTRSALSESKQSGSPDYETWTKLGPFCEAEHQEIADSEACRGTGETIPFSCYPKSVDGQIQSFTSTSKIPQVLTGSNTDVGTVWAGKEILADLCSETMAEYGELIGTAFVARDLMQIVDALDEDGMLRYWGFSYGTALGETVAAMFPDRMDKVVLDGVLNPEQYWSGK